MSAHFRSTTLTLLAASALATSGAAQTLYGLDGVGGSGPPLMVEITGGSGGACGYPAGPFAHPPLPAAAGACVVPGALAGAPSLEGDIAVNRYLDRIWVATGNEVIEYDRDGVQLAGFPNPLAGAITGLGFDSTGGRLWIASAFEYAEVLPSCGTGFVSAGPFPNPHAAPMTDIAFDPHANRLWACFADGVVGVFLPGMSGLLCNYDVTSLGLATPLTGLDMDTRSPGFGFSAKRLFVTDAATVAHINVQASCLSGVATLASSDFAFPDPMFPVSGGDLSGLAFAAHGVTYGLGSGPSIDMQGMALPGTTPTIELEASGPGVATLIVDFAAQCPPIPFKGMSLYVLPTIVLPAMFHTGTVSLPAPIPFATPIGMEMHLQWIHVDGATAAFQSSPGMLLTTARP
jgi:hypothetical protein